MVLGSVAGVLCALPFLTILPGFSQELWAVSPGFMGGMAFAPDGPQLRRMSLRAGRHDSVTSVARRFGVRPDEVAQWNSLEMSSSFRPGQTVIVFMPSKSVRTRSAAAVRASHKSKPVSAHRVSAQTNRTRLAKR